MSLQTMDRTTLQEIDLTQPSVLELRRRLGVYMKEFQREDDFINKRMTWFVMSQSFLAIADAAAGQQGNSLWLMTILIPFVGFLFAVLAHFSIRSALDYQQIIRKKKDELIAQFNQDHNYDEHQLAMVIEPWGLGGPNAKGSNSAPKAIPLILAGFWIVVLLIAVNVYIL